jgi:cytochrome c oxidase cbb3-type subunit 3
VFEAGAISRIQWPAWTRTLFGALAWAAMVLFLFGASVSMAQNGAPVSQRAFDRDGAWNNNYSTGRALFEENCSGCHGEHGRGGLGLPLNLQSFLTIADTGYLMRSMRHGRPLREMPAFEKELTRAQMRAIALYIKSWQYQPSRELPVVGFGDLAEGKALFSGLCTGCHGIGGKGGPIAGGGHVIGAVSGIGGPALADPGFLKSATDQYIKATLMFGRIGTPMGAYLKGRQGFVELRESEIDSIVAYLRSLQPKD